MGALFHADCLSVLARMKPESVQCVFADPPFNIGKDYGNGPDKDLLKEADYLRWSKAWIDACIDVLSPGGTIFIYILPRWGYQFAAHLEARGMTFRHWIAMSMKGTFPRGRKLYPAHYALLYFTKGDPVTFNKVRLPIQTCRHCGKEVKDYGGHRKSMNPAGVNLTDFWEDTAPSRHGKFKTRWHINELKPMISERCIQMATNEHDIVFDPFGGGGSTFESAELANRHWVGTETVTVGAIEERMRRIAGFGFGQPPGDLIERVF
jgi:site-specific DNA-methyltransferase (adenine-specific)